MACCVCWRNDARLTRILEACESQSHLRYLSLSGCKGVGQEQKQTGFFVSNPKSSSFLYFETLCPLLKRLDLSETSCVSLRISLPYLVGHSGIGVSQAEGFGFGQPHSLCDGYFGDFAGWTCCLQAGLRCVCYLCLILLAHLFVRA